MYSGVMRLGYVSAPSDCCHVYVVLDFDGPWGVGLWCSWAWVKSFRYNVFTLNSVAGLVSGPEFWGFFWLGCEDCLRAHLVSCWHTTVVPLCHTLQRSIFVQSMNY